MEILSERISRMSESATIKMAQLGRELKAKGKDIINLSLGEPDFDTPEHIKQAGIKAINEGYTHYSPVPGYPELRKAICDKLKRDNNLSYSPEQIVVSTGAKQSLINVVLSIVNPGDEVIVPSPYWVSYAAMVQLAEATMVNIPTSVETDFKFTASQLEKAITPKTRMIIYSSPCNPTGTVFSKADLESYAMVLAKYPHVYIMSDEIYEYINYAGRHESIAQFDEVKERVIVVNGFSKGFAMTGWRLGYIAAPLWIAKACDKMQGQFTSGTCSIAQKAAEAAVTSDLAPTFKMRDAFRKRRDLILSLLKNVPGFRVNNPQGAFYVFPDVSAYFGKTYDGDLIKDSDDFAMFLLKAANVSTVGGKSFGDDNCIRLSYACSEDNIRKAVERIKNAVALLN
ncbi:MAG TPA: pyridoxal phosphate-dependent aminotransferase [Chitinophagales bacterium]|nr:pyridoxal phosphate-dependent aminotransferase [Chitinophagales bacterium]